jgi:hypothetical protein
MLLHLKEEKASEESGKIVENRIENFTKACLVCLPNELGKHL